jgi:hypothetical protein
MRAQAARRNAWFYAAQDDVDHDRFEAAVHDWEMMLAYESDAQLRDAEAADIARCRVLTKLVRKGIVSAPTARVAFIQNGCRLPSPR